MVGCCVITDVGSFVSCVLSVEPLPGDVCVLTPVDVDICVSVDFVVGEVVVALSTFPYVILPRATVYFHNVKVMSILPAGVGIFPACV